MNAPIRPHPAQPSGAAVDRGNLTDVPGSAAPPDLVGSYYRVLARATRGLDGLGREQIYAKARSAAWRHLVAIHPPLTRVERSAQSEALESAILQVEFDHDPDNAIGRVLGRVTAGQATRAR